MPRWSSEPGERSWGCRCRAGAGGPTAAGADPDGAPEADPAEVARTIALRQLEARDRSRRELEETLRRRGVPDGPAAAVLDGLTRVGLVDDARFAQTWVDSRRRTRGLSRRALAAELTRKGIGPEETAAALEGIDEESEQALADRVAERRAAALAGLPREVALRRLAGQLARKGHGAGTSLRAASAALGMRDDLSG